MYDVCVMCGGCVGVGGGVGTVCVWCSVWCVVCMGYMHGLLGFMYGVWKAT